MSARPIPRTSNKGDWPRRVADELSSLGRRVSGLEASTTPATGAYTATADDNLILADAAGGAFTVTLPLAGDASRITVKKVDASANNVTVDGSGSETIDGAANKALTAQWQTLSLQSDGTAWFVI